MNIETYNKKLRALPPAIQAILNMQCSTTTDVSLDNASQLRTIKNRAWGLRVKTTLHSVYDNAETVTGKLGQVLKYYFMNPIYAKQDSTSGAVYEVGYNLDLDTQHSRCTPEMFKEFIDWIGKDYPDFIEGMRLNPNIIAEFMSVLEPRV